jgi:hypothetical protein
MSPLTLVAVVLALSLPGARAAADTHPEPPLMPPAVQDRLQELFDRFLDRIEPGFDALGDMLGDLSGWHAPEILPNGDILIRRRAQPPAPPYEPPDPEAPDRDATEPPVTDPFEL